MLKSALGFPSPQESQEETRKVKAGPGWEQSGKKAKGKLMLTDGLTEKVYINVKTRGF